MRPPRVVLAKPGLDGHDRGIKVIAMALRDAGAEEIVQAAADEDADVIGISVLSGAHLELAASLVRERDARGLREIPIVLGGTIAAGDVDELRALGVAAVFPVGASLFEVVEGVRSLAARTVEAR